MNIKRHSKTKKTIALTALWKTGVVCLMSCVGTSHGFPIQYNHVISQSNPVRLEEKKNHLISDLVPTTSPPIPSANAALNSLLQRQLEKVKDGKAVETKIPKEKNKVAKEKQDKKQKDGSSFQPSTLPTTEPKKPSTLPTIEPTYFPSTNPSAIPSASPSVGASIKPTSIPTSNPTLRPSAGPSTIPSKYPSATPSLSFKPTSHLSRSPSISLIPTLSKSPSFSSSSNPSANPTMQTSVQLEVSVGIKNSTKNDAASVLNQVLETTNMTDVSEAVLKDTFEKLRESELKKTVISGLKVSLNKDVNNLIVLDNDKAVRNHRNRIRRLDGEGEAQIIVVGNREEETSFVAIDDEALASSTTLSWYRVNLHYSVWYEGITFDQQPETTNESAVIPKNFDKEAFQSNHITPFPPNDTGTLIKQLNDIIAKLINNQKLVKVLHEKDDAIMSVSLPGQEANAQQFIVPTSAPTKASEDEVAMLMVRNHNPLNRPLKIEKMGPLRWSGISLFVLTSIFTFGLFILSKRRKNASEQFSVSLNDDRIEFVLEASRHLPPNLHVPSDFNDNPDNDEISQISSRRSQVSSHYSSTIDSSRRSLKFSKYLNNVPPIKEEKFPIKEVGKLPLKDVDDCAVNSNRQLTRLLQEIKKSPPKNAFD